MMQRWCAKLQSLGLRSTHTLPSRSSSTSRRLIHTFPQLHQPLHSASRSRWSCRPLLNATSTAHSSLALHPFIFPVPPSVVQVRHVSSRERKKRRKPMTPVTSKLKKTKMKFYSSYKSRFRTMNDGNIRALEGGKAAQCAFKVKEVETQTQTTCHSPSSLCQSDEEAQFLCLKHRESTVGAVIPGLKEGNIRLWPSAFWCLFLMFAFQSP